MMRNLVILEKCLNLNERFQELSVQRKQPLKEYLTIDEMKDTSPVLITL